MAKQPIRKQETSSSSTNWPLIGGLIALGVIVLGVLLALSFRQPGDVSGIVSERRLLRDHDEQVTYPFESNPLPPMGGPHSPIWQTCDVYDAPIKSEHAIHSLEHGIVWITYQEDLPESDVDVLRELAEDTSFMMLSPYPNLQSPVVLTSWGYQLEVDSVSDNRIDQFINTYRLGPDTPEPGATCDGGITATIGSDS